MHKQGEKTNREVLAGPGYLVDADDEAAIHASAEQGRARVVTRRAADGGSSGCLGLWFWFGLTAGDAGWAVARARAEGSVLVGQCQLYLKSGMLKGTYGEVLAGPGDGVDADGETAVRGLASQPGACVVRRRAGECIDAQSRSQEHEEG